MSNKSIYIGTKIIEATPMTRLAYNTNCAAGNYRQTKGAKTKAIWSFTSGRKATCRAITAMCRGRPKTCLSSPITELMTPSCNTSSPRNAGFHLGENHERTRHRSCSP
nr:MAG TPA: hypothetical protein [Bacteriophage sp.]